ncbi:MAG: insulinase family protein [Candidatus Aminicenantes bacterium]|nr:insulinase family protein [Candidatus Aminicenantes bacterium]
MIKKGIYCFLFISLFTPVFCQTINITSFELPNGLKVILSPSDDMQAAAVCIYNMNGARHDLADNRGISYLFQYLMFNGNENLESYDHVLFINKMGGIVSGRVSHDNSVFCDVLPASEINVALWLESERLKSLRLDDASINYQKNQIFNRINRLGEASLNFRAQTWINSRVFDGLPYAQPLYGDLNKIRNLNNDQIRESYQKFQNLSNILLIIAGKFDINELKAGINKYFQNIPPGKKSQEVIANISTPHSSFSVKNWVLPGLKNNFSFFAIKSPGKINYDFLYFDFLRYYLTDPRLSHLDYMINKVNKLNVEIEATYTDYFEANVLTIQMSCPERINLEKAKYILQQEFMALTTKLINNADFRAVRSLMEIDFNKNTYSLEDRCLRIGEFYHMFGELNFFDAYLRRLRRVSLYDILESAKKYLKKENQVILNVYGE